MRNIEDFGGFEKITRKKLLRLPREATNVQLENERKYSAQGRSMRGITASGNRPKPVGHQEVLVGDVLLVTNILWGFEDPLNVDHPGVCAMSAVEQGIPFLKGTDVLNVNLLYRAWYLFINPTPENGLKKMTAFKQYPFLLRFNSVKNLYPERYLGHLDERNQQRVNKLADYFLAKLNTAEEAK